MLFRSIRDLRVCASAMDGSVAHYRDKSGLEADALISSPNGDAVVRHIPDPFSLMMASTNAHDFNECNALVVQGHMTMEAIEIMVARRAPVEMPRRRKDDY